MRISGGLEILLVEDSQSVGDPLKQHLELLGANVTGPAATTAEATKLMTERLPNVALLDFHLRGEDSSGLIARLRGEGVPVIVLSGSFEFSPPVSPRG
jgi:DNA-binding response OmpR family regulator